MPSLDTLRAALTEPPAVPLHHPDPRELIRRGRRRRALARARLAAVATTATAVLVAVGPSAFTSLGPLPWSGTSGDLTPVPATGTGSGTAPSDGHLAPRPPTGIASSPAASSPAAPSPGASGPGVAAVRPVSTTAPAAPRASTASAEPPAPAIATPADENVPTAMPTPWTTAAAGAGGAGGGGFGLPAGGGSRVGSGVPVSPTGRYAFTLACAGAWQDHAVQVSFGPLPGAALPDGPPAGTFDCRAEQTRVQASVDAATTERLQRAGTDALMTVTVVRRVADGGYVPVGPTLHGLSVTIADLVADGAPTAGPDLP